MAVIGGIPRADLEAIIRTQITIALVPFELRMCEAERQLRVLAEQVLSKAEHSALTEVANTVSDNLTSIDQLRNDINDSAMQLQSVTQSVQATTKVAAVNKATPECGASLEAGMQQPFTGGTVRAHPWTAQAGYAWSKFPDPVVLQWKEPVQLAHVAFRLWDQDDRTYTYNFKFQDQAGLWHSLCNQRQGTSWQRFTLNGESPDASPQVAALKWIGRNSTNDELHILEIEAF
mmetsp:Transcript_30461/g.87437  ORF Transcript_30461/g.87437 Transcript_30461/m.87437 type:complete len:232 (-) Transcript_30461:81-776(-)|eukprot:CAMPEP_0168404450 /NCGR_PEP_ID=MMETSP0228-20121227/24646_1 /TAXON_ID=133427 /ORGANISM="Protoceratium reticulatum, Strain CCCM 535 (=CCMP 1889)" /LENGTH=231 /DNA_ID=CAMNT_0008418075 /DNA_START=67 /DNA_END=762 /DNA_ORIENTATION=-